MTGLWIRHANIWFTECVEPNHWFSSGSTNPPELSRQSGSQFAISPRSANMFECKPNVKPWMLGIRVIPDLPEDIARQTVTNNIHPSLPTIASLISHSKHEWIAWLFLYANQIHPIHQLRMKKHEFTGWVLTPRNWAHLRSPRMSQLFPLPNLNHSSLNNMSIWCSHNRPNLKSMTHPDDTAAMLPKPIAPTQGSHWADGQSTLDWC
jgi:hypothetical protein